VHEASGFTLARTQRKRRGRTGVIVGAVDPRRLVDALGVGPAILACLAFLLSIPASVALRGSPSAAIAPASGRVGTARLHVEVRRAVDEEPVASATVRVFGVESDRYFLDAVVQSASDGRAEIEGLSEGAVWVIVEARGFARTSTALVVGRAARSIVVALEPANALAVRIADEKGAPVADATVLVEAADQLPFGALSDAGGRAVFSTLGRGPYKLRVYARGYEPEVRSKVVSDVDIALHPACGLDVRVSDAAGVAVPAATVLIAGASMWPARQLETGSDGRVRIPGLAAGAYDLKASKGLMVSRTEVGVRAAPGAFESVELRLENGRMVPIVVTDGEGDHPIVVPNADVLVVEGGVSSFPLQGRTDSFGKVTLGPIASGPATAAARASGFVERGGVAVPDAVKEDVRIALVRGARLLGDVVDAEGHPIGGARVEVIGTDPDGAPIAETPLAIEFRRAHFAWALKGPSPLLPGGELGVMSGPIPPIPNGPFEADLALDRMVLTPENVEPWVTDLRGEFRASPLPAGRVRALVKHPSYVEATSDPVTLGAGGEARVRVVLRVGGSIEGTVVDEYGLPVAGARVDAAAVQGTLVRTTRSADDGSFAFATLPSEVMLSLARPGDPMHIVLRRTVAVKEGDRTEIELVVPERRDPLVVVVDDDSSRPVKMAQITALSLYPERPLRATEFTDDAGRATLDDAVGLPLRIVIEAPGFARLTRELAKAPEDLRITLALGVPVEGHVTAVRGRTDVEGASVELLSQGHRRAAFTDSLGRFRFTEVTPGPAHLRIDHPDYAIADVDVVVESTGRADRAFDLDAVDLAEPGVVEGHVVDREGRPVSGARVGAGVVGAYVPVGAASTGTVTTKADGAFRLDRVRPGRAEIGAYAADVGRGRATVEVDPGHTHSDVQIRLDRTTDDLEPSATGGVAVTLAERHHGARSDIAIVEVAAGSEAEHAGLVAGDLLRRIDNAAPASLGDARRRLAGPDGSDVVIEVSRNDATTTLRVKRERVRR
jgi:protocatechuate 3,4-dioxygenase beta subunit